MDLYEYQGKQLFKRFGIPVSDGRPATTPAEARAAAEEIGGQVVVKAQVLTGGRGKAGGIKLADDPADAEAKAGEILGLDIRGHVVRTLWIESASEIAKEYYLSITFDRGVKKALFMFTTQGGMDIEEVAEKTPDALVRLHVDALEGFQPYQARRLIYGAGVEDPGEQKQIAAIVGKLYDAFVGTDAMLCEINPLIVTPEGEVKALDSKFTVDDNALYKHPDIAEMRDTAAADPLEALAREKGVTYVKLDGEVGILGNGAGLVMSTLDVIALAGGRPANFCDLGGGGDAEGVVDALEVITQDPQVKSIFFNIFGGITRCDEVARGILAALERMTIEQPIVVRLDGTNAEEGRKVLADAAPDGPLRRGDDAGRRAQGRGAGDVSDWSSRAEAYRNAPEHREGEDLDLIVRWAEGAETGARRRHRRRSCRAPAARGGARGRQLRPGAGDEAGRDLPRRGPPVRRQRLRPRRHAGSRRTTSRTSPPPCAEMARVSNRLVVVEDTLYVSEQVEEAEKLRDPTHVRSYTEEEWRGILEAAGLEVEQVESLREAAPARGVARPLRRRPPEDAERVQGAARRPDRGRRVRRHEARPEGEEALVAIIVDKDTKLVVQGLTGSEGSFHGLRNKRYGTQVVAGVTPGQGRPGRRGDPGLQHRRRRGRGDGREHDDGLRAGALRRATRSTRPSTPGIATVICIAEGLPAHEMLRIYTYIRPKGVTMLGPNCPGALSPGKANVGIIPAEIFTEGNIGLVSRSGTLTYQIGHELTQMGLGNSTIVGIGGDPIVGSSFIDVLEKFESDPQTEYVVMVGEIGGDEEEKAAAFIEAHMTKPVVAYIAGFTAPPGKTMGHAGAIISGSSGTAQGKKEALEAKGIRVGTSPTEAAEIVAEVARS